MPALEDLIDAAEVLDEDEAIDAADRVGESAAQVLDFLDLAPQWQPGEAVKDRFARWMRLLARGSNQIASGVSRDSAPLVRDGLRDIERANRAGGQATDAVRKLASRTGFSC